MKKISCSKCGGVYLDNDLINDLISFEKGSIDAGLKVEKNPFISVLKTHTYMFKTYSEQYLMEDLGNSKFCECLHNQITRRRILSDQRKGKEFSDSEMKEIDRRSNNLRLNNAINYIFKKGNF